MFTARLTSRWNAATVEPVTLGTFRTGGEAYKALKAALAADDKWFSGEVFSHHYGRVLFSATNPCPDWVR
jgi:hypothetical protein